MLNTQPIPVWHLITKLELGGAQQHTLHVVKNLDRDWFAPRLLTGSGGDLFKEAQQELGSLLEVVPSLKRMPDLMTDVQALWWLTKRFKQALSEHTMLVVHTHSSKAGVIGRAAAALAGVPMVVHSIHGFGFHEKQSLPVRTFYENLERLASRVTTHFVAVSNIDINTGIAKGLFRPQQVTLIRSGFDLSEFLYDEASGQHLRKVLGIPSYAPVAGTVANFKPQKAPMDFITAMITVARKVQHSHFIYAGDGPLRPQAEMRVREAGLADRFHFIGWRRDVARVMSALDCFVLASHWEGLPKTIPQAMAIGLPVVATCVGGTPEVVLHGENGFLVSSGDTRSLAHFTKKILINRELGKKFGCLGQTKVQEFSQDIMVRKHQELYCKLYDQLHSIDTSYSNNSAA